MQSTLKSAQPNVPVRPKVGRPPPASATIIALPVPPPTPQPDEKKPYHYFGLLGLAIVLLLAGFYFFSRPHPKGITAPQVASPAPAPAAAPVLAIQGGSGSLVGSLARVDSVQAPVAAAPAVTAAPHPPAPPPDNRPMDVNDRQRLLSILSKD